MCSCIRSVSVHVSFCKSARAPSRGVERVTYFRERIGCFYINHHIRWTYSLLTAKWGKLHPRVPLAKLQNIATCFHMHSRTVPGPDLNENQTLT